jgi:hypothetical protein
MAALPSRPRATSSSTWTALAVQLIRGTDKPDLIVADNNYYRLYLQSLQSIQRITDQRIGHGGCGLCLAEILWRWHGL